MEEQIVSIFGLKLRIVQDDGNTDSCSECVFREGKCPLFKGHYVCQNSEGAFNSHFVKAESKNDKNIRPPHFSVPETIIEIGKDVWSYDTSFAHDLNGNPLPPSDEAKIKKSLVEHSPMTVCTYPVLREFKDPFSGDIDSEYFIAVIMHGIPYQFYILNCKSGLLTSYKDMIEWLGEES